MSTLRTLLLAIMMCCVIRIDGATAPEFGSSIVAAPGDPVPSLGLVRGKVALLLFFQSWCPVCNGWSPELIQQLEAKYGTDSRIVLIGVKTDGDAAGGKAYLKSKGANLDHWLIVADTDGAYVKQVLGKDELWQYAVIKPDGSIADSGQAGRFYKGNGSRQFALAREDVAAKLGSGVKPVMMATYPAALDRAVRLAEARLYADAIVAAQASGDAKATEFTDELTAIIDARVAAQAAVVCDDTQQPATRLEAYQELTQYAKTLKSSSAGKAAASAVKDAVKDKAFKREVSALTTWNGMQAKLTKLPPEKAQKAIADAYPRFIKSFAGTVMAERATAALAGK